MEKTQTQNKSEVSENSSSSKGIPWIILAFSLLITGIFTYSTKNAIEEQATSEFTFECNEIKNLVYSRLDAHAQILWNGASFINASDSVSRADWKNFIIHQRIDHNLPGIQGVGYSVVVSKKQLAQHEQSIRNEGFPRYKLRPEGDREMYTSIVYLEPFSGRNLRAFGYDMYSEPIRRAAMQQACDSNNEALSGKVQLVQETNTDIQAGVLMYVPVYHRNMRVATVDERRKAIKAWVYSPYRMKDLMSGILGNQERQLKQKMSLHIYDNDRVVPEALLFDSESNITTASGNKQILSLQLPINFKGTHWLLAFTKSTHLVSFYFNFYVLLVFIAGTALSILIFLLALSLQNSRKRLRVSNQLAEELNESLYKQLALFNAIPDAVFVTDKETGRIEDVNPKASEQYGFTRSEFHSLFRSDISLAPVPAGGNANVSALQYTTQFHRRKDGSSFPVEITRSAFEHLNERKIISVIRDITERTASEADLRIKNEVFENSIAAQSISDSKGVITHVNRSFLEMWGKKVMADAIGQPVANLFADSSEAKQMFDSVNASNSWQGEFRALRDDGSVFVSRGYTTSIRNSSGEITGYQTTNLDITHQKEAEKELLNSKEHYRKLVENANDIILVTLPDQIVFANKRFYEVLGYHEDEVLLKDFERYIYPDDLKDLVERYIQLSTGTPLQRYPARIITRNGLVKWAEFSGILVDWDGQGAVLSFISDFTNRKLAEDALRESELLYKSIINTSPDNITVTDLRGAISMISPSGLKMFGFDDISEYAGQNVMVFIHPDDRSRAKNRMGNYEASEREKSPDTYKCIRKDGSIFETEINGEVIHNSDGKATGFVFVVRDITERKKAEQALLESEEKWRSLVNNSPDYIALHDKDGKYLFLNRFAEGYTETDLVGHSIYEFLAPESVELFRSQQQECIQTWKPVRFEHAAVGDHGEMRIYDESIVPLYTKNAEINFLAVARDVTEQRNYANKLRESEEYFRLIFEEGAIAMALVDINFRFTQVNRAFESLFGYSADELLNLTFHDFTDPEFIQSDVEGLTKLRNREISVYRTEKKYIARDKSTVWGLVQVSIMFNKNNEFLSQLVMISNITERKKAEESLLKSEEIFNQFMLNSPIYVFFKDENIRSLRLSRNFEQMLGKPLDKLLGKTMDELFPSDIAKAMVADDKRILHEGRHVEVEEEMNGRQYSTTKFPIVIDGKPVYLAGYTMDITDRKQADNLIKATLREKEILLSEVHHRVKNNLQVVSSLLNLQANRITDTELKDVLAQSRNRIRSIALVHEKLYQSGNFADINFSGYAQALISELFRAYLADPGEIGIKTDIENINIPLVYAIPCGLILNEIVSNCLKHAFPPDFISEEKNEIRISLKMLIDNQLQLKISDNGIGLPDDYTVNKSSSLGLYLIQILSTDQLDGKLDINNEKGTIFTITFDPFQR